MKRIAVYSGSFDPPTNGHAWMIQTASQLFDKLYVAVGTNPGKRYMFTVDERVEMLERLFLKPAFGEKAVIINNVSICSFENEYLIPFARSIGANYIVRGIRSEPDYQFERSMKDVNDELFNPGIETIYLMPPSKLQSISSSTVKGLIGYSMWENVVKKFVPRSVHEAIVDKVVPYP